MAAFKRSLMTPSTTFALRGGRPDAAWFSNSANSSPAMSLPPPDSSNARGTRFLVAQVQQRSLQRLELGVVVRHGLQSVALVGDRFHVIPDVLQGVEHVKQRVVEPGIAFRDQNARTVVRPFGLPFVWHYEPQSGRPRGPCRCGRHGEPHVGWLGLVSASPFGRHAVFEARDLRS